MRISVGVKLQKNVHNFFSRSECRHRNARNSNISSNLSRGATYPSSNFSLSLLLSRFLKRPKSHKSLINILWQVETAVGQNANDPQIQCTSKKIAMFSGCYYGRMHLHCMQNVWFLLVLLVTGREKTIIIIPIYWLLFSINLNASHVAVQIPYITSDFQCKYFQLWWNRLTLCVSIHGLVTFLCLHKEKKQQKVPLWYIRLRISSTKRNAE